LSEMVQGRHLTLDADARAAVAAWASLLSVTARAREGMFIDGRWTRWLRDTRSALPTLHVWLGHYVGALPFFFFPRDARLWAAPSPTRSGEQVADHAIIATVTIGELAVQTFGGYPGETGVAGSASPALTAIWPDESQNDDASWPPEVAIDD